MLLPALGKAREKARQISCVSNLKGLNIFFRLYLDDSKDLLCVDKPRVSHVLYDGGYINAGHAKALKCPAARFIDENGGRITMMENYVRNGYWYGFNYTGTWTSPEIWPAHKYHWQASSRSKGAYDLHLRALPSGTSPSGWVTFLDAKRAGYRTGGIQCVTDGAGIGKWGTYPWSAHGQGVVTGFLDGHAVVVSDGELRKLMCAGLKISHGDNDGF